MLVPGICATCDHPVHPERTLQVAGLWRQSVGTLCFGCADCSREATRPRHPFQIEERA